MLTGGLAGNVLYAVNKPDAPFYVDVVTDGIYFLGLVLFTSLGMHAILVMYSSYIAVKAVAMQFAAHRHLTGGMADYFSLLKGAAGFSLAMIASVLGFQHVFSALIGDLFLLIGSIAVGAAVYAALTLAFDKKGVKELRKLMKSGAKSA